MLGPEHAGAGQAGSGEREGCVVRPLVIKARKRVANVQEHEEEKQEPLFLNTFNWFEVSPLPHQNWLGEHNHSIEQKMLECQ